MPKISNHAKNRMKQRAGVTTKNQKKISNRVYEKGIKYQETTGLLHEYINKVNKKNPQYVETRVYGDNLYIFKGRTLITVLDIPQHICKHINVYIKPESYLRYVLIKPKLSKKRLEEVNKLFQVVIMKFIHSHNDYPYSEMIFKLEAYHKLIRITFKSKGTLTSEMRTELQQYFSKYCYLNVTFQQNKKIEISETLRIETE